VTIGSGKSMAAKAIGNKPTMLQDASGNMIELMDTLYIPEFKKKIISPSKLLDQGYKVEEWTKENFWLSKNNQQMQVKHKEGYAMYYFQACSPTSGAYMVERTMDINKAHHKMAHMGEDIIRKTMAQYGIKLTGKLEPCNACLHAKARAKNMKKTTECVATTAGKCLYLDTMGPFEPSISGTRYDAKIVDQFSHKSWDAHENKRPTTQDSTKASGFLEGTRDHCKILKV